MTEYGFRSPRGSMPAREFQAHLAILIGRAEKKREEVEKAERDARTR